MPVIPAGFKKNWLPADPGNRDCQDHPTRNNAYPGRLTDCYYFPGYVVFYGVNAVNGVGQMGAYSREAEKAPENVHAWNTLTGKCPAGLSWQRAPYLLHSGDERTLREGQSKEQLCPTCALFQDIEPNDIHRVTGHTGKISTSFIFLRSKIQQRICSPNGRQRNSIFNW